MFECVINISEGADDGVLERLRAAAGAVCVDVHTDADHHRSVFTLADRDLETVVHAARVLTRAATEYLDLSDHVGVHPRFGAIDVVPFVTLSPEPTARNAAVDAARTFARWAADELEIPTFLYGDADALGRSLPEVRRDAFTARTPDFGPHEPHPRFGAIAVGARPPMIAVNVELASDDLALARRIASAIRERDGGLAGVRALGFPLPSQGTVQVSMNLVDLDATGMEAACGAVAAAARQAGVRVERIELVGLVPRREVERWSEWFAGWTGFDDSSTVEARVDTRA